MFAALLRLLMVASLALMPFGMAAASAAATHHAPAAPIAGHCDDKSGEPSEESHDRLTGCAAGCSMFIAEHVSASEPATALAQSGDRLPAKRWTSVPAETATPPPKLA
jgi:hypothetical protein